MTAKDSLFLTVSADPLMQFLLQIVIILLFVRFVGRILSYLNQPQVIGEIIAGILLGPTAFGQIPGFSDFVFPSSSLTLLNVISQISLVFFMFFLGLELDPQLMFDNWRFAVPIASITSALRFGCGVGLSAWLYTFSHTEVSYTAFVLFIGASFSFTAFPVLARIMTSSNLIASPLGIITISVAAVDDLIAWTLLAVVLALASGGDPLNALWMVLIVTGYLIFMIYIVVPYLRNWMNQLIIEKDEFNRLFVCVIFFILCSSSFLTQGLGVDAFFGAFSFGLLVPREGKFVHALGEKIELLIVEFFLPVYFCLSGIKTELGNINSGFLWGVTIAIVIAACAATILSVMFVSRFFVKNWRINFALGILINTRGLITLIALNIGLEFKILDKTLFAMFVVMSVVTTMITAPVIHTYYTQPYLIKLQKKKELEDQKTKDSAASNNDLTIPVEIGASSDILESARSQQNFTKNDLLSTSDAAAIENAYKVASIESERELYVPSAGQLSALMNLRAVPLSEEQVEEFKYHSARGDKKSVTDFPKQLMRQISMKSLSEEPIIVTVEMSEVNYNSIHADKNTNSPLKVTSESNDDAKTE